MDTEEMYRRGIADAERDELNPFYYQHYYPYRRGYDETRRRLHRPGVRFGGRRIGTAWILAGALAAAGWWYTSQRATPLVVTPTPRVDAAVPTSTRPPTRTPIFPTATPRPSATATPSGLRIGGRAFVATESLRVRREPSLDSPIVTRFRKDAQVTIVEGPREADGYRWWKIEGQDGNGWSAERSPEGEVWLKPVEP